VTDVPEAPLALTIERLTFGPDALAHHEGQAVFVPLAAPGDRVHARVVERRADYLRAELTRIERSGPERVPPRCPVFGRCGGCQWQHVAPEAQRDAKGALVAEQLARLAGIRDVAVRPTLAGPSAWAYRSRVTLVAEGRRLGFHAARSHRLEPIEACAIAAEPLNGHLAVARAWLERLRVGVERITVATAPGGVVLVARTRGRPREIDVRATEALLAAHATVRGAVLAGGGERVEIGDPSIRVALEPGLEIEAPADVFSQVNVEGNLLLVQTVLALGAFAPDAHVLDLYCGIGNLGLPLARRGVSVTGVEREPLAVAAAQANAARLGLAHARFVEGDVAAVLGRLPDRAIGGVVLDPPRAGALAALRPIIARRPPRIVYVSCDVATLARDLRMLVAHGYRLDEVQPIDLFPQTYHVETVAMLRLT
jgi:23S rRNA (uracil1939-C5)-methyltransferase